MYRYSSTFWYLVQEADLSVGAHHIFTIGRKNNFSGKLYIFGNKGIHKGKFRVEHFIQKSLDTCKMFLSIKWVGIRCKKYLS